MQYNEFLEYAKNFLQLADEIGDCWILEDGKNNESYLRYNQKFDFNNDVVNIEYHVVYSLSYEVPVLFFRAYHSNGSMVSLEDAWKIFSNKLPSKNLTSILTQMDHPILFRPFLALHPCHTNELLSKTPNSKNLILTFLSLIGPYVKLNLNENYGILCK